MKLALFSGSFNPPHLGHLMLPLMASEELGLDLVVMLPSGKPVNKPAIGVSAASRLEMVTLAIATYPLFAVDDFETNPDRTPWSWQSVEKYGKHAEAGNGTLFFFVGEDWIDRLSTWKNFDYICERVTFAVFRRAPSRPDAEIRAVLERQGIRRYVLLPWRFDISSTMVRQLIAERKFWRPYVPEKVYDYIREKGLYL